MNFYDDIDRFSGRTALVSEDGSEMSYAALVSASDRLAEHVPPRSLAFLVCENCIESVAAYIGSLRHRVPVALIDPKLDPELFAHLLESYRPQYLFCPKSWHDASETVCELGSYQLLKLPNGSDAPLNQELAVMLTTSGSTGSPKLVMQAYRNIDANAASIAQYLEIGPDDRPITTLPMHYTYGLSILQSHLLMGARIVLTKRTLLEKDFWRLLREQQATTFGGVPYTYEILKKLRFGRMDLPSLRYLTQAGGKLPKGSVEEFSRICREKGMRFIVMYGQTEATARMSYLPWERVAEKPDSIGIAIPGGAFSLIDADGRPIETPDTVGTLVYRGPNVTLGYATDRAELAQEDRWHGELHTGDMAKRDADGFYYITGRLKRFLKLYGNRVNLDELEQMLQREGWSCACGGKDDLCKIYLEHATDEDLKKVVDFLSGKTGLNHTAFQAVPIAKIPRNDAGKILYPDLEAL